MCVLNLKLTLYMIHYTGVLIAKTTNGIMLKLLQKFNVDLLVQVCTLLSFLSV